MNNKVRLFCLFLVALSAGCASVYIPPQSGKRANLIAPSKKADYQLRGNLTSSYVEIAIGDNEDCGSFFEPLESKTGESIVETKIPAQKKIFVRVTFTDNDRICRSASYFIAEDGETYDVVPEDYGIFCQISIFKHKASKKKEKISLKQAYVGGATENRVCSTKNKL